MPTNPKSAKPLFANQKDWKPQKFTNIPGPLSTKMREEARLILNAGTDEQTLVPFVQSGKAGGILTDLDGNEYVDALSAWGAEPWGPENPKIRAAMMEAWDQHGAQISCSILTPPAINLAKKLVEIAPKSITRAEFSVTGTQAVESTVRLMREASGKPVIFVFGPVYHGESTTLTAAMSSDTTHVSKGTHAFAPGVIHLPYPCQPESPFQPGAAGDEISALHYLDWITTHQISPDQIAGVLIEPITTEGGVIAPTQLFWDELSKRCEKHDWLLAVDEVQTGIGRCGTALAIDLWEDIEPDIVILGKGLSGGGMPISAILGSEKVMAGSTLSQGSTFGWQPAACAAALAGLEILEEEGVMEHINWLGEEARRILGPLVGSAGVTGVRAFGAEVGVSFAPARENGTSRGEFMQEYLLDRGVLAIVEDDKPFVRLQPPLNLDAGLWQYALRAVADGLRES